MVIIEVLKLELVPGKELRSSIEKVDKGAKQKLYLLLEVYGWRGGRLKIED